MTSFLDISTELLFLIFSKLPSTSYSSLSLTNRRFHRIANPKLYDSLYLWGTENKDITERVFERDYGELYDRQEAPVGAARVYNLDVLTQTLQSVPGLATHVKRIELIWDLEKGMEDVKRVLRFLDIVTHLQLESLILAPPSLYFQVPTNVMVTTLRIRHSGPSDVYGRDIEPDINQLHKQCCLPSVNEITVAGWNYWSDSIVDGTGWNGNPLATDLDSSLQRAKTSPLTILSVSTFGAPGYIFSDILSWPTNLRVFEFDCSPLNQYQMPGRVRSEDFVMALQRCRDTLEELSIRCSVSENDSEPDVSNPINLRAFSNLRRLCIRHDFLLMNTERRRNLERSSTFDGPLPQIHEVLPPSLEQLHLEIADEGFSIYEDDAYTTISSDVYWFFDTLEQLAIYKADYLPRLTRVITGEALGFAYGYFFTRIMNEECERGKEVIAAFAREDIRFSCFNSGEEPRAFD